MASLKDVADLAQVPMLIAFHALDNRNELDEAIRRRVLEAAKQLNYTLKITQVDIADLAGVA
ncbi:MAG: LacI family DNA-binding transcriptional regulator, partial [Chloroflexi bacterium]|nr:LacI family DNA-binding transcriptional regulator [Chloroflexota bacterium]